MRSSGKERSGGKGIRDSRWILAAMLLLLVPWCLCGRAAGDAAHGVSDTGSQVRPGQFFGTVLLGGFRAVLIDYLWLRTDILSRKGEYYELLATYRMLADLQPHAERVWVFNSSNMVNDISAEYHTAAGRYAWIRAGLEFAEEGLDYNPDSAAIRSHLAETYYYKFAYGATLYSRELRRLLREDPDRGFLRVPERPSVAREALLYWMDLPNPQPKILEFRVWAALSLLWEQRIRLREARLDMLEALEDCLTAAPDECDQYRKLYEKRKSEYEQALQAPPDLSPEEAAALRATIAECLDSLEKQRGYIVDMESLRTWEEDCGLVLKEIDHALDIYQTLLAKEDTEPATILGPDDVKTLETRASPALLPSASRDLGAGSKDLDPNYVKTLETQDMTDILPVNSLYVAPIYKEVVWRIVQATKSEEEKTNN